MTSFFRPLFLLAALSFSASPAAGEPFQVANLQVVSDREVPEVCITLSGTLSDDREVHFEDFVRVTPDADLAVSARGTDLCLAGFNFDARYTVTVRAGLPSAQETALAESWTAEIYIPDRPASLAFRDGGYVLPRRQAEGLPLTSINLDSADLSLLRISDRNLVAQLRHNLVGRGLSAWDIEDVSDVQGETVWSGSLEIAGERNRPVTTVVPLTKVLEGVSPGLYVMVATNPENEAQRWETRATQWFVVSDLGLTSYRGEEGLWVGARSLDSAAPLDGVRLELIAHNNEVLGEAVTDADGFARFPGGLLRGNGGNRPHSLLAFGAENDFSFLDLTKPGLDLLDRGVAGRAQPGELDGFLWTERGIYRPGEKVHFAALLRDRQAAAVTDLPLTFIAWRPDGKEFHREVLQDQAGGFSDSLFLPENAPSGPWALTAHVAADSPAIGRTDFTVADFVPPQIEVELDSPWETVEIDGMVVAEIAANYLYGAPGSNLNGEITLQIQAAAKPFPDFADFRFGLVQEPFSPTLAPGQAFVTDAAGMATGALFPERFAGTSHPLEAKVLATIFDLAGRPVTAELSRPLRHQPFAIGIRPRFADDRVAEGAAAGFQVVTLDPNGRQIARSDLQYVLYAEDHDYVWYRQYGQWQAESVVRDRRITGGSLATAADSPAEIETTVDWGRYRLEVFDPQSEIASSLRFSAGWWVDPLAADRPDKIEITFDKESYRPGDLAKIFVKPPFAGEVTLALADRGIRRALLVSAPAEGTTVEVPVEADWTAGLYVLANAFTSGGSDGERKGSFLPSRAVGTAWLALDPEPHLLTVGIEHPDSVRPGETSKVSVTLGGLADGEEAFLTLAAVDDGVLQVTDYQAPDPQTHFLGQRLLGVRLHDLYGALIDPRGDALGRLRSGGDLAAKRHLGALPERSSEVVSHFSGIHKADADGRVEIELPLPDFNGRLRLMAVAWSASRFGQAQSTMLVRSPIVAQTTLPRFLAPGDQAELVVSLRNLDGPSGDYTLNLETDGPIEADLERWQVETLAPGDERRQIVRLGSTAVGVGRLRLEVTGPGGLVIQRSRAISVRPADPFTTSRQVAGLEPGRTLTVTDRAFTGLRPETVTARLTVSALPQFDVAGLLGALDRYPYGCVEQTTSRALPLLYVDALGGALGGALGRDAAADGALRNRVQQAIGRLAAYQSRAGAFGLWGPRSSYDLWLSAYVMDFLVRAEEAGFAVPTATRLSGLTWLRDRLSSQETKPAYLAGAAYAHYVLAKAGDGNLSDTRYFYETRWDALPSDLARAQLAAALSWYGDRSRARDGFARLSDAVFAGSGARADYGTSLRDLAATVALMAESRQFGFDDMKPLVTRLSDAFQAPNRLSTQEMVWLTMAAHGFAADHRPMEISVDGEAQATRSAPLVAELDPPAGTTNSLITVLNRGDRTLYQTLSFSGVPESPLPAARSGFRLKRGFFAFDGSPLDLDQVRQNDSFAMVIEGESEIKGHHRALIVHLLPAGWEIQDMRLGEGVQLDAFPWLGKLSKTEQVEYRDDRFVAAIDLTPERPDFRTAFIVRAVTPGRFALPGGLVEDMYRPSLFARQARGEITVLPAGG